MKKYFYLLLAFLTILFVSCGDDDDDLVLTESDVVGTWTATVDGKSAIFMFSPKHNYSAKFGTNTYTGSWTLEGNTIHGVTLDPIHEYFKFVSLDGKNAKIKYWNDQGLKYDIAALNYSN